MNRTLTRSAQALVFDLGRPRRSRRQRGTTLLEGLIAFLLLSLGMLAVAKVQVRMRADADVPRRQSEALRIVQGEIEAMRAFSVIGAAAHVRSFEALGDDYGGGAVESDATNAHRPGSGDIAPLTVRRVDVGSLPGAKQVRVAVDWADRTGEARQVTLDTIIAGIDPALSGALGLPRANPRPGAPSARSIAVPVLATDLRDASSATQAMNAGNGVLRFDNRPGVVTARCTSASPEPTNGVSTTADLGECDPRSGLLVSGSIGFEPMNRSMGNAGAELLLSVVVVTTSSGSPPAPRCTTTRTVQTGPGALPHWAYRCVVQPAPNGRWSGRILLLPSGWTIGTTARDHRVCRYSADLDGSGAIDANIEHPASYADLDTYLPNQNFRIVAGDTPCPRAAPVTGGRFVDLSTLQHQP